MTLTLSWYSSLSFRNQSIDLLYKSVNCFLYDRDLCHERVKVTLWKILLIDTDHPLLSKRKQLLTFGASLEIRSKVLPCNDV